MDLYVTQEYEDDQYSVNDIKNLYSSSSAGFGQISRTYDPYSRQPQQAPSYAGGSGFSPAPSTGFPSAPGFGQYSQGSRFSPTSNPFGPNPFQR